MDDHIKIENEEPNVGCEGAQTTEYLTKDFVARVEVQDMIASEMKKSTSQHNAPELKGLVEDTLCE